MSIDISDRAGYLQRLSAGLSEKLKIAEHIPPNASDILDVGCADGAVTRAIAQMFQGSRVLGVDTDLRFVDRAIDEAINTGLMPRLSFWRVFLRDILAMDRRFNAVLFVSVLHEIYTYGSGKTSVVKALADAHELLRPGGIIIIRDMPAPILNTKGGWRTKIAANSSIASQLEEFETMWGGVNRRHNAQHFLLKYIYLENWQREVSENYLPLTLDEYLMILRDVFGMEIVHAKVSLLPYLADRWKTDFGFTDAELRCFSSTGVIVARKPG